MLEAAPFSGQNVDNKGGGVQKAVGALIKLRREGLSREQQSAELER